MGTVGVWRPGDIANVLDAASKITGSVPGLLQGIGAAATGVGDLFKDVVGQDGVTGLIREGVDAAGKIDNMVEHHLDPTAANHDTSAPTGGNDHNTGGGGTDSNAPVQQTAGIHTTDTTSTGASQDQATPAPGHAIQSNISQSMSTTPSGYQPFNLGSSTTTTSAGASAGSFVSSPMMQSRGEESEHRPKFLYKFPAATGDEPGQPGTDNQHQSTDSEQP
jgi:hypothetical protein